MKIINCGLIILSICIGSTEAMQERPSEQAVVSELRSMSRELNETESANVGELLHVLQLNPEQTEVRIVEACSIINGLHLPFTIQRTLKNALTNRDSYTAVLKVFFDNAQAQDILFSKELGLREGLFETVQDDENVKTYLRDLFLNTEDLWLQSAFVTFVATRLAEPTIGARYFHGQELANPFVFILGSDSKATYKSIRFCRESSMQLRTIIRHDTSSPGKDGVFRFNSDLPTSLLHELGHTIDSLMSLRQTIDADKTLDIMHYFIQKKDTRFMYSSLDYANNPTNVLNFLTLKLSKCKGVSNQYRSTCMYKSANNRLRDHLTPMLNLAMTGMINFCGQTQANPQHYNKSSTEFWQIIGLRLIQEAPNRRVLYINKFSDFFTSLSRHTPIRLDHLIHTNEPDDEMYMREEILTVYRALAKLHQIDFDQYLSNLSK